MPSLLPGTLLHNDNQKFICKNVYLKPQAPDALITRSLRQDTPLNIPIAHGEGRFVPKDEELLRQLEVDGQIACRYLPTDNPNGSVGDVMGICDSSGLVLGLMPHPERFLRWSQHPYWTRLSGESRSGDPLGLQIFKNAVSFVNDKSEHKEKVHS